MRGHLPPNTTHSAMALCLLFGALFGLVALHISCSAPATCNEATGLSDTTLNPSESTCANTCECNNQTYFGACVGGTCASFKRESCEVQGLERICRIPKEIAKDGCLDGLQVCQPDGIKSKVWGNCIPNCGTCSTPGKIELCYTGPNGTRNVGICKSGDRKCNADSSWGKCTGQVIPTSEICNKKDDDCNGVIDDNCKAPSERRAEPSKEAQREPLVERSPQEKPIVSPDHGEKLTTIPEPLRDEATSGEDAFLESQPPEPTLNDGGSSDASDEPNTDQSPLEHKHAEEPTNDGGPSPELPVELPPQSESFSESPPESSPETGCRPGEKRSCYSGPSNTSGKGICKAGTQTCSTAGLWNACTNDVTPKMESCDQLDNDCDGAVDEGLNCPQCTNNATRACYSGVFGTEGIGLCKAGTQTCSNQTWGPCNNEITPRFETCDGTDRDCDGFTPAKASPTNPCVTTFAGSRFSSYKDGPATQAQFNAPNGIATDASGNLYIADEYNHRVRKVSPSGDVSTLAGSGTRGFKDGPAAQAQFSFPTSLAIGASGILYIVDRGNRRIRKIEQITNGTCGTNSNYTGVCVSSFAGDGAYGFKDGPAAQAQFGELWSVALGTAGDLYIADRGNSRIRKIEQITNGTCGTSTNYTGPCVSTFAGSGTEGYKDGPASQAQFNFPHGLAFDTSGNLYIADRSNRRIRKIEQVTNATCGAATNYTGFCVSTFAGSGTSGHKDGPASSAQFGAPTGLAVDASGSLYIADSSNYCIRKITPNGDVSTFAGYRSLSRAGYRDGPASSALFKYPEGLVFDASGNLYVSDVGNHRIRKIEQVTNKTCKDRTFYTGFCVSTFAGSGIQSFRDGPATQAQFRYPSGLVFDSSGYLYVADKENHRIRKVTPNGEVSTIAGSSVIGFKDGPALQAQFHDPHDVALDSASKLYIADRANQRIRKIEQMTNGTCGTSSNYTGLCVSTFAGSGTRGFKDGPAAQAQFNAPGGMAFDMSGNLYIADGSNQRIRKIEQITNGTCGTATNYTGLCVSTFAGSGTRGFKDGPAAQALFSSPTSLAFDASGNLYVVDKVNNRIRKIEEMANGTCGTNNNYTGFCVSTFAGSAIIGRNGPASQAGFFSPSGLAFDASGNLYVTEQYHRIRKIEEMANGTCGTNTNYTGFCVSTFAGISTSSTKYGDKDGPASQAQFNDPNGLAFDALGNLYIGDTKNNLIRKIILAP